MALAHGVDTRSDLPLTVSLAVIGSGMALTISFVGARRVVARSPQMGDDV
jgi:hypothetical protein